MKLTIMR